MKTPILETSRLWLKPLKEEDAPGAFLWITLMLAAPVAFSMRYVYLLLVAFPLIPLLPMWTKDEQS